MRYVFQFMFAFTLLCLSGASSLASTSLVLEEEFHHNESHDGKCPELKDTLAKQIATRAEQLTEDGYSIHAQIMNADCVQAADGYPVAKGRIQYLRAN